MIGAALTLALFFWLMTRSLSNVRRGAPAAAPTNAITAEE
jgi:hypothetical protein